jgi:glycosyltransferase involved in cell wall biosynthesis
LGARLSPSRFTTEIPEFRILLQNQPARNTIAPGEYIKLNETAPAYTSQMNPPRPARLREPATIPNGSAITRPRITAIVPAYNEAGRIGAVVQVLSQVNRLTEIVVVDDCSFDDTAAEAEAAAGGDSRLVVLKLPRNLGKGGAVFAAWQHTRAPFLVMIDADLINLKPHHIQNLIAPVIEGRADMSIGVFKHGVWRTDAAHALTPWLSGQRCFRSGLLSLVSRPAAEGYGLETALTLASRKYGFRVQKIALDGVTHPLGEIPRGGYHGWKVKGIMLAQIVRAWWLYRNS